jgi:sphingomyelin phosphodiesterase acid-like 3
MCLRQLKKFVFYFYWLLLTSTIFPVGLAAATPNFLPAAASASFVSVADIHFNPFYSCDKKNKVCPLINKLVAAPATKWSSILSQYDTQAPRYKEDTNYVLLKSTLQQLKKTGRKQHAQFVLVLGDFLGHDYKKNYQYFTGDTSEKGVQCFIDKTMQFITSELAVTFPNINVYMVVGNNDGYAEHYTSQAVFYKNIAPIWSILIQDKKNREEMRKEFAQGGYYALDIDSQRGFWQVPRSGLRVNGNTDKNSSAKRIQKKLRLIVLNTTFFSTRGVGMGREAQREFSWLEKQLALLDNTQRKALIALHIPNLPQVSISRDIPVAALGLWQARYSNQFLHLLKCSAPHIMAVLPAHLHMDWAQLLQFKGVANAVVISATPSISPVVGNNPGYKVYFYDPRHYLLKDYFTYYYPLQEDKWKLEYAFNQTYQADCHVCTLAHGLKQLAKNSHYLKEYKKFFSVDRQISIFSNLTYPALVCDLQASNYAEYTQCVKKY